VIAIVFAALLLAVQATTSPATLLQSNRQPSAATIRGRVLLAGTDIPVRKARIIATPEGGRPLDPIYSDGEGHFELRAVPPGRYTVAAWKSGFAEARFGARNAWDRHVPIAAAAGAIVDSIRIELPRGASISGRVVDAFGDPLEGRLVTVARLISASGQRRLQEAGSTATDDLGEYRVGGLPAGTFVVEVFGFTGSTNSVSFAGELVPTSILAEGIAVRRQTMFYLESASLARAQPIALRQGEDASGIDLTFVAAARLPRVSGRVVDAQGQPGSFSVSVEALGTVEMGIGTVTSPSGEFSLPLPPGEYTIVARDEAGIARMHLSLDEADISGLQLVVAKGARLSGRVLFEGTAPHSAGQMMVRAAPPFPGRLMQGEAARVSASGTFVLSNLIGTEEIGVVDAPRGWTVKSILVGGRNVLDTPVDFKGTEDIRDAVVVLTDHAAELTGTITNAQRAPSTDASLVIFSADRLQLPRRAYWIRPDHVGRFVLEGLAPGDYLIAIVDEVDDVLWQTREYLDRLRGQAVAVTLADGEKKTVDLKWNRE
jgi:hypothetical protein